MPTRSSSLSSGFEKRSNMTRHEFEKFWHGMRYYPEKKESRWERVIDVVGVVASITFCGLIVYHILMAL
jgi:hypothetical protein